MTRPTPRERLTRAGLSAAFADLVLREHAHQLADKLRDRHSGTCGCGCDCAEFIDPEQP